MAGKPESTVPRFAPEPSQLVVMSGGASLVCERRTAGMEATQHGAAHQHHVCHGAMPTRWPPWMTYDEQRLAPLLFDKAWALLEPCLALPPNMAREGDVVTAAALQGLVGLQHDTVSRRVRLDCAALGETAARNYRLLPLLTARQWRTCLLRSFVAGSIMAQAMGPIPYRVAWAVTHKLWRELKHDPRFRELRDGGLQRAAALDVVLLRIAQRSRAPGRTGLHVVDAELAMSSANEAAFRVVARDAPATLPLLRAALLRGDLTLGAADPLQAMRAMIVERTEGDSRVWKRALRGMREVGQLWRASGTDGNFFLLICAYYRMQHGMGHRPALPRRTVRTLCKALGRSVEALVDLLGQLPHPIWRALYLAASKQRQNARSSFNTEVAAVLRWLSGAAQIGLSFPVSWRALVKGAAEFDAMLAGAALPQTGTESPRWLHTAGPLTLTVMPLASLTVICDEAHWGRNCLRSYVCGVASGEIRLMSLRDAGGQRVATLGLQRGDDGLYECFDLRLRFNRRPADDDDPLFDIARQVERRVNGET